jgi:mannose-6-phosphate isomerase-like protein (cupin superfamily)
MRAHAFNLEDCLIVYGADGQASRIARRFDQNNDAQDICALGIAAFTDDRSVHADHWEIHPAGDEILCVLEGRLLARLEGEGVVEEAVIEAGQALIVPRGRWHRLQVLEPGRLLFATPRPGSRLRQLSDGDRSGHPDQVTERHRP